MPTGRKGPLKSPLGMVFWRNGLKLYVRFGKLGATNFHRRISVVDIRRSLIRHVGHTYHESCLLHLLGILLICLKVLVTPWNETRNGVKRNAFVMQSF